jgi:hypothetical protein
MVNGGMPSKEHIRFETFARKRGSSDGSPGEAHGQENILRPLHNWYEIFAWQHYPAQTVVKRQKIRAQE